MKFIKKGEKLNNVRITTSNVVIQEIQSGDKDNDKIIILGAGNTLDVDENDVVTWHDPLMMLPEFEFNPSIKVFIFYFARYCDGLNEAGQDIAHWVNSRFRNKTVYFIGHSKSGLCLYNASRFVTRAVKLKIVTISAPYKGTVMASSMAFEMHHKKFAPLLNFIHKLIFSDHNVDRDIVPESRFIKNLPTKLRDDIIMYNIVSRIKGTEGCRSLLDFLMVLLEWAAEIDGDAIVPSKSQMYGDCYYQGIIISSHTDSLKRGLNALLNGPLKELS